jgi:hypothetical protein
MLRQEVSKSARCWASMRQPNPYHGSMKVVLAPNIGLEEFWGLHTLELVRPIPADAG